ncbi:MAG: hypothetical protein ACOC3I_01815, partial [Verrucomicrobiota bacterium]
MKFLQIFVPVAVIHLAVIVVLLFQPGCQVRQSPPPPPETTRSGTTTTATDDSAARTSTAPAATRA